MAQNYNYKVPYPLLENYIFLLLLPAPKTNIEEPRFTDVPRARICDVTFISSLSLGILRVGLGLLKPNSITLASSELVPNMFGAIVRS